MQHCNAFYDDSDEEYDEEKAVDHEAYGLPLAYGQGAGRLRLAVIGRVVRHTNQLAETSNEYLKISENES